MCLNKTMVNIFKLNTDELKALVQYKEVLEENKPFPKNFWKHEKYQQKGIKIKCRILAKYCLENIEGIEVQNLPKYNITQIKSLLLKNKLFGMLQTVFNHEVLLLLKNAYPNEFQNKVLAVWMWSKHGIWHDDNAIIEAVQTMVRKEGIRRINDIPSLDWKKRLIKHGIYNVLSYFNWSIYALFNFVYPGKFHPADFKYKLKWKASESLENAFYFMHKIFKQKRYTLEDIMLLSTSDFRKLGLAGMLISLFGSSTLRAKEYYLYKTLDNEDNQKELMQEISILLDKKQNEAIIKRLKSVAKGKYIYNLHKNCTIYGYLKRHAKKRNLTVSELIESFGFIYKSAKNEIKEIDPETVWDMRKKGMTYVEIANELGSNPTTISKLCIRHFGGDPLIPRPLEDYITVQELMNKYKVDHKTIMKIVNENGFENHTTIRFRYLNKKQIIPALEEYVATNRHHKLMVERYKNNA